MSVIYKNVAKTEPCGALPLLPVLYNLLYYSIPGEKHALLAKGNSDFSLVLRHTCGAAALES